MRSPVLCRGTPPQRRFYLPFSCPAGSHNPGPIRERLRDAKAAKRQRGLRCAGLVPFGFAAAPTTRQLEPVPAERELVCQIFEKAAAASTPPEIAGWLNAQGVTTKKTGKVGGPGPGRRGRSCGCSRTGRTSARSAAPVQPMIPSSTPSCSTAPMRRSGHDAPGRLVATRRRRRSIRSCSGANSAASGAAAA